MFTSYEVPPTACGVLSPLDDHYVLSDQKVLIPGHLLELRSLRLRQFCIYRSVYGMARKECYFSIQFPLRVAATSALLGRFTCQVVV